MSVWLDASVLIFLLYSLVLVLFSLTLNNLHSHCLLTSTHYYHRVTELQKVEEPVREMAATLDGVMVRVGVKEAKVPVVGDASKRLSKMDREAAAKKAKDQAELALNNFQSAVGDKGVELFANINTAFLELSKLIPIMLKDRALEIADALNVDGNDVMAIVAIELANIQQSRDSSEGAFVPRAISRLCQLVVRMGDGEEGRLEIYWFLIAPWMLRLLDLPVLEINCFLLFYYFSHLLP